MATLSSDIEYLHNDQHEQTDPGYLGYHYPATEVEVFQVLAQSDADEDGRSDWRWVRLSNGDLILGVFPQGDTYFSLEEGMR